MKILTAQQQRELDALTIEREPIHSIDLMERASKAFVQWWVRHYPAHHVVAIVCGTGNNGGDGLAVARMLYQLDYEVTVYIVRGKSQPTADFEGNLCELKSRTTVPMVELGGTAVVPSFEGFTTLVDALLGSGLNRPLEGFVEQVVLGMNLSGKPIASIDLPSGLCADAPTWGTCVRARHTLTFSNPKLALLMPENEPFVGRWAVADIGLDANALHEADTPYFLTTLGYCRQQYKVRSVFAHKGTMGRALLIVGAQGTMGAAVLAARACLRAGVGLLTVHSPLCGYPILQTSVPEAMVSSDVGLHYIEHLPVATSLGAFQAIGVGCGIGRASQTAQALEQLLHQPNRPLVMDADALNMMAENKDLLRLLPPSSILTPHLGEFERLFGGAARNGFEQLSLLRQKAQELGVIIVLKGAYSRIALPDGRCFFNTTGNPGMATGGSGDVLTGILTALLAQGYTPSAAALLGVYLHGAAGDAAAEQLGPESLIAGDIVQYLPQAFGCLR
jgi:hydroxyethylthiazole kinase-like uncharacterized protein yjeF